MNRIKIVTIALFWSTMILLSIFSDSIHNKRLPKVETFTVSKQDFQYNFLDEDGNQVTSLRRAMAIPKSLTNREIYVIIQEEKNGELRNYAQKSEIILYDDYYSNEYLAVWSGLAVGDLVIISDNILGTDYDHIEVNYE